MGGHHRRGGRARACSAINVKKGGGARRADSTDAVATFLTRRFGIAGGLAWLGVLTFGVVSEQLKTRREVREARENTKDVANAKEVTTASGLRYTDLRVGGGEVPRRAGTSSPPTSWRRSTAPATSCWTRAGPTGRSSSLQDGAVHRGA